MIKPTYLLGIPFLLVLLVGQGQIIGQDMEGYKKLVCEGYAGGNQMTWESGLEGLKKLNKAKPSYSLQYEILLAEYGLIGFLLSKEKKDQASKQLEKTLSLANAFLKKYPDKGEFKAILGGLYGLKIGLSPVKGVYLGPRSLRYLGQATEMSPTHPLVWVELANAKYHTPSMFGGDMEKAQEYFKKGVELFEQQGSSDQNWLYLHAVVWEGKAHEELGQLGQAKSCYQKALRKHPNFVWVKEELLPQLQEK
ncbi:MAG: tetratricopeptide repeat protein [Bacteroidota bacterium]